MLIVSRMDELPSDLPRTVHQALGLCVEAEADAQARKPWGTFTGMAMRFKQRFGEPDLGYQSTVLASPPGTYNAAALLREIIRTREPQPVPGVHAGTAFLAEGLDTSDELAATFHGDPQVLHEQYHDLVAAGQARQFRIMLGVMVSGWRFVVRRERHESGVVIEVAEPGGSLPDGLDAAFVTAVTELDSSLAAF